MLIEKIDYLDIPWEKEISTRIQLGDINAIINLYLVISYLLFIKKQEIIKKEIYQELCDYIYENLNQADNLHKKVVCEPDLISYNCSLVYDPKVFKPGLTYYTQIEEIVDHFSKILSLEGSYEVIEE